MLTKVYGKYVEFNENLPAFNYITGRNLPFIEVKAVIKGYQKYKEVFKVSSMETAEEEIKEIIDFFNASLTQGEREREFISLFIEDEEVAKYNDNEGMTGWLDPSGKFFPCEEGEHSLYAYEITNRMDQEGRKELEINQHIPMSKGDLDGKPYLFISGKLTPEQVVWLNRFFDKLCRCQKGTVKMEMEKQGFSLDFPY